MNDKKSVWWGKPYTHVLTLEDAHIYDLERRTNENTKSSEENLNITLATKKKKFQGGGAAQ